MHAEHQDGAAQWVADVNIRRGYERLWGWFELSYASWLTLPRVLMHEMPDEWQKKMAALLEEWNETWDGSDMPSPFVTAKQDGRFTRWPWFIRNYRHPDREQINALRRKKVA